MRYGEGSWECHGYGSPIRIVHTIWAWGRGDKQKDTAGVVTASEQDGRDILWISRHSTTGTMDKEGGFSRPFAEIRHIINLWNVQQTRDQS